MATLDKTTLLMLRRACLMLLRAAEHALRAVELALKEQYGWSSRRS